MHSLKWPSSCTESNRWGKGPIIVNRNDGCCGVEQAIAGCPHKVQKGDTDWVLQVPARRPWEMLQYYIIDTCQHSRDP